ncbi:MAG: alanine racemase [Rhodobacteraceae bacterium]|nr:alanine racemase [Paracoccaceae bacterium]
MASGQLHIDLDALATNWRALDQLTGAETGAVVKADGYGLGLEPVARCLARTGARWFFVAVASEGARLRAILGHDIQISVLSGHMAGDTDMIRGAALVPMLNDAAQWNRHRNALPGAPYGVQLDSGMNRLGFEPADWSTCRQELEAGPLRLVMSHLACADVPAHPQNTAQLRAFTAMTRGVRAPRSLSATGGILLGRDYHFDITRPGIGLYGGAPFTAARPVLRLSLPVVQTRNLAPGETVGYGGCFTARGPTRIATVSGGYADGLLRAMGDSGALYAGDARCPLAGRVSMDLMGVDVTHLGTIPDHLDILGAYQGVDALADAAGTISYEILTALGARYQRIYHGAAA